MTDAGNYTLKLTNSLGEATKSATVTVKCELCKCFSNWNSFLHVLLLLALAELRVPKILQGLSDTSVSKGEQLELKVRIRGQPNPQVEW